MASFKHTLQVLAATLTLAAGSAIAAQPVPVFGAVDFSLNACANYGDFQSCSAQYLNFLATGDPKGTQSIDFVVKSSQGLLKNALVVMTGSQAAVDNTDIGTNIDNAYRIFSQTSATYGTSIGAGENPPGPPGPIIDPSTVVAGEVSGAIFGSNGGGDLATAWDIGLQSLITALTVDNTRRDLLIFFDNNQTGTTVDQNVLVSGLVCVRDKTGITNLPDICYELVDQNGTNVVDNVGFPANFLANGDPTTFQTTLEYGDPLATDTTTATYPPGGPVLANGTFCVDNTTKQPVAFDVDSANDCPANSTFINNNLGTNVTEFIVGIPELNARLEELLALGYDLVTTQLLFQNNNDGFEDVFILAGGSNPPVRVPEPGTMLLLGLGVFALAVVNRRRKF